MRFPDIALEAPRILLPRADIPTETWAVIACDQHTSFPGYWEDVARHIGPAPSTLHLVFPEAYLGAADHRQRIADIRAHMVDYVASDVLQELPPGFVLTDRQTPHVASRRGLLVALDLEQYSYAADARTLIRTTEGTVVSRLAPRIEVRRGAPLEVPHIMVLIDDAEQTVIEPLFEHSLPLLYDTQLMLGGGRVRGWHVREAPLIEQVVAALRRLLATDKSGGPDAPMLYAMGDGNHSFATAQAVWQQLKDSNGGLTGIEDHAARYALVELVNLHDSGLVFEPIHRALFGCELEVLLTALRTGCPALAREVSVETCTTEASWEQARRIASDTSRHRLPFVAGHRKGVIVLHEPTHSLPVVSLQEFLTDFERTHAPMAVDYIHGEEAVRRLGGMKGNIGLLAEVIDKHALFATIRRDGPLPRKSFSLGEAEEKRYYMECRRIA
ncbi:MAG: DUF1015 domain-containing protein [bacterium]|nr:DUF1015 domain-containing protein [bacterium]